MAKPGRFGSALEKFQEIFLAPPQVIAGFSNQLMKSSYASFHTCFEPSLQPRSDL